VLQGDQYDVSVADIVGNRSWAFLTSSGWVRRGAVAALAARMGKPATVIDSVQPNPTVASVVALAAELPPVEVLVAMGGGSVLDSAKAIVALQAMAGNQQTLMDHLRDGQSLPPTMLPIPIVAVPTTSGTGSEVTRWGTIWGDGGVKYSVSDERLYPSHAVLDPMLCASMPAELTLVTGLDALSHAMESVWNRRHSPLTDALATRAIQMLHAKLSRALAHPDDRAVRETLQTAALISGLAMGTTQTAIAHSISYPFTARFGVPHGLACSFTLPAVARYNAEEYPDRMGPIAAGLSCLPDSVPETLERWLEVLGIGTLLAKYVVPAMGHQIGCGGLITTARAANNIRYIDEAAAQTLVQAALQRFAAP